MNKTMKAVVLFCIMCLLCGSVDAFAQEEKQVVRVGYPHQEGLTTATGDNTYSGYTVDYLNELSKYTDWEYEYVEVEGDLNTQILTLMEMLERGEIDLLGAMNYSEELEKLYYYPSYHYGNSYTSLAVRTDDARWMEGDYTSWDGIRVATYPGMEKRMQLLKKFAEINRFTYEEIPCDTVQGMVEAVKDGEADAVLQVDISMESGFRSIARFNPQPFYFAVTRKKPDLYRELNQALYSLLQTYPAIQTELYEKYFSYQGNFYVTEEISNYIESLGTLKVLFFKGNKPIQDETDGRAQGIAETFFQRLHEDIGLEYEPVFARDYYHGLELVTNGEVDLVAAIPFDAKLTKEGALRLTRPYFESYGIVVTNKTYDEGNPIQPLSANVEQKMGALEKEKGGGCLLDANCVSYYTRKKGLYDHLRFDWGTTTRIRYSVGIAREEYGQLLGVINAYSNSLSEDTRQEMLYANAHSPVAYTFGEFLYVYKWMIIGCIASALVLFYLYYGYVKNRKLRQSVLESERIHQFSMMTNECLFEYDFRADHMNVQNSRVFFPGETVVSGFARRFHGGVPTEKKQLMQYALCQALLKKEDKRDIPAGASGADGWYRVQIKYIGEKGECAIGRIFDVTQEIRLKEDLERRARTDALTGLYNRVEMERLVDEHLRELEQGGVLALMDIDNFKNVNDTMGHVVGDQLIREFAGILRNSFRQSDLKARLGGDEFIIFFSGSMGEAQLADKLRSLIDTLDEKLFSRYPACDLSVSIGAARSGEKAKDYRSLYRLADNAMYVVKFGGKNDFFIAEDEVCMKKGCDNCKKMCRRRDYLLRKGRLRYDPANPGQIIAASPDSFSMVR